MNLFFIDPVPWPYRADAPLHRPLGGTQSAACYLMMALAQRGLRVSLMNAEPPHTAAGVRGLSQRVPVDVLAEADALIVLSDANFLVHGSLGAHTPRAKKILWMHHAPDQPAVQALADPAILSLWDAVVFVSDWQRRAFHAAFPLLKSVPCQVLRNAVAPAFLDLFSGLPITACKAPGPRLAYSSTPFRGLDRLIYLWPWLISQWPGITLQVFSSMKLYDAANPEEIEQLLEGAARLPGVLHVGPVPQPELALALREALILAYPNTFPETACIAVMEALAAGCVVVTSDLGALPETLGGHGVLVPVDEDAETHARNYGQRLLTVLGDLAAQMASGELEAKLQAQVAWATETYAWPTRAAEWEAWLGTFIRSQ